MPCPFFPPIQRLFFIFMGEGGGHPDLICKRTWKFTVGLSTLRERENFWIAYYNSSRIVAFSLGLPVFLLDSRLVFA